MQQTNEQWDLIIEPKNKFFRLQLGEVWRYRDLLVLFVKRDLVALYKQTLLGPLWFLIQPIFTTLIYSFMFGRIANISTDGKPAILFYLSGLVCWNYFSECVNGTSHVFISNANLFGKVYFPRLVVPFATVISAGFKFGVQFLLFVGIWCYYVFFQHTPGISLSWHIALVPLLLVNVALLGMSVGVIVSSLTTKYRDLRNLLGYALQVGLYTTPIIFPLAWLREKSDLFYKICLLNPMTGVVETFKYAFLGTGVFQPQMLVYSFSFTLVLLFAAIFMFNKVDKTFVDTV